MPTFNVEIDEDREQGDLMEVDFEVYCSCGNGLCNQSTGADKPWGTMYGTPSVTVEPCEKCLEAAEEEGLSEGYDEGLADGREEDDG